MQNWFIITQKITEHGWKNVCAKWEVNKAAADLQ